MTTQQTSEEKRYRFKKREKEAAYKAAKILIEGFAFHRTQQGEHYWDAVYCNLVEIAGREP